MNSDITGLSSMATRQILAELADAYQRRTGRRVAFRSLGGVEAARRIRAGETVDVVVLASNAMRQLAQEGFLVPGTGVDFARSGIAVAIPTGAPRPSLANGEAVRDAILKARRIGYSTGPSGDHLLRLWHDWGIAETISSRLVRAPAGVAVGELVVQGEVDLGFQQLSELLNLPGIDVVGPLPPEIQALTVFSAAVGALSPNASEARLLIDYLGSADTEAAKRRHGMEPA